MPLLDVSDILADPDFADTFDVIRYGDSVDADGVGSEAPAPITGLTGVIQPASELSLQRLADGALRVGRQVGCDPCHSQSGDRVETWAGLSERSTSDIRG